LSDSDDDSLLSELLVMRFMTDLANAALGAVSPEAVMLTAVDIIAAKAIATLEELTGISRDVALTKHTEHVARILAVEHPRQ